jgi:valyl-tRNA synthetase
MNRAFIDIEDQFQKYRVSDALMIVYKLFWDEFSSWYLECIKPAYEKAIDALTHERTLGFIEQLLHMLHPFMPFISEEIWQLIRERKSGESLMVSPMPAPEAFDQVLLDQFEALKEAVTQVRSIRKEKQLSPREALALKVRSSHGANYHKRLEPAIIKLANLDTVEIISEEPEGAVSFIVKNVEYYVPVGDLVDVEEEMSKLKEELKYTQGFLVSVEKKMNNERFVQNAPAAVVEKEKQKMADARGKIKVLEAQIQKLKAQA